MARFRTLCVLAFAIALPAIFAGPASAAVTPTIVDGNPNCADLNASTNAAFSSITSNFGFKIESGGPNAVPNGVYQLTDADGELTGGAPTDTGNTVTISSSDGTTFNWAATLGIDAVIVKGGDAANAYVYSPEDFDDTGLQSPLKNGNTPELSHVEFCYDYDGLTVTKTANTTFTRTWTWGIQKSGDQTTGGPLSPGQAFNVNYDVTLSASAADTAHAVSGSITATNPNPAPATVTSVTDQLNDGTNAAVANCTPALPAALDQGESVTCSYQASGLDGTETTNTATASGANGVLGAGSAPLSWSTPTTITDECVDVTDDKAGTLGQVCAPADLANGQKTFQYTLDASNGGACGVYTNTASFETNDTDTTGQDSWTVTTTCAPPTTTTQSQPEPQQQVQQQEQPQGQQEVLGEGVTPGSARLGARTGCQGRPFTVRVKGRSIRSVVFSIDGKRVKTVTAAGAGGAFTLKVDPRKFKPGSHKVVARVTFDPASGTRPRSLATRFSRCVRAAQAPTFTG